jgi:hypothetical protein
MLKKWNDGTAPFGQINACGVGIEHTALRNFFFFPPQALTDNVRRTQIPLTINN